MAGSVRFVLDGRVRELRGVDPAMTVLQWLRGVERRCGTKEGCAEGDCGACTVVLGELREGRVRLLPVNACILFLPALDGKALFTVESLRQDGQLHPVQQALVDCHGSQCGFCTPGFVMSLYALYESGPVPSRRRIDDALGGNLCRCTGYRPIADAARRAYELGRSAGAAARDRLASQLRTIARQDTLALEHGGHRFFAPRTGDALAELCERYPAANLLAGGTDVGLWVTKGHRELEVLLPTTTRALRGLPPPSPSLATMAPSLGLTAAAGPLLHAGEARAPPRRHTLPRPSPEAAPTFALEPGSRGRGSLRRSARSVRGWRAASPFLNMMVVFTG
jgi:xanthine dehydrogenase small subunit